MVIRNYPLFMRFFKGIFHFLHYSSEKMQVMFVTNALLPFQKTLLPLKNASNAFQKLRVRKVAGS